MPTYDVMVSVQVEAKTVEQAYFYIHHALANARKQEVVCLDCEVTEVTYHCENCAEVISKVQAELSSLRADYAEPWCKDCCTEALTTEASK